MIEHVVRLPWNAEDSADSVSEGVADAFARGAQRVEYLIPASAHTQRRAAHRAGLRREGVLRGALTVDGRPVDGLLYAGIAGETTEGPAWFSTVMNAELPKTRVIGHALFTDRPRTESGARFLALEVSYKSDWELPGGVVEPHESPRVGCEREILEEIGLEIAVSRLLCVDWLPSYLGWDDAVEFIFDGGVLSPEQIRSMVLGEGEIVAAHWLSADDMAGHLSDLAQRRLAHLLADGRDGHDQVLYERGAPVTSPPES